MQRGEMTQALEFIDQALRLAPDEADSHIIRAVILAQSGRPAEAREAFETAVRLAPGDPKAHYNLAVHLDSVGEKHLALASAQEALRLDPSHGAARSLVSRLEGGAPTFEPPVMSAPAFESHPAHRPSRQNIAFIRSLGVTWDAAGWLLTASGAIVSVGLFMRGFSLALASKGSAEADFASMLKLLQEDPQYSRLGVLALVVSLISLIWMIMDMVNRNAKPLWALPFTICCLANLQWIVMPFYLASTRRNR